MILLEVLRGLVSLSSVIRMVDVELFFFEEGGRADVVFICGECRKEFMDEDDAEVCCDK